MGLSRPVAATVLVVGLVAGVIIIAGFLFPNQLFDGIGLYLFLAATVVEIPCAIIAMRNDVIGTLR
jgi:hypothetical protein